MNFIDHMPRDDFAAFLTGKTVAEVRLSEGEGAGFDMVFADGSVVALGVDRHGLWWLVGVPESSEEGAA